MKSIYHILILGIMCLVSTNINAQFEEVKIPPKTSGGPESERTNCFCLFLFNLNEFTNSINTAAFSGKENEWLQRQEELLQSNIEGRLSDHFPDFETAQSEFFKAFPPVIDASKIYRERILEELESEIGFSDNGELYRSSKQNAVVLSAMAKELSNISEGRPREHYFGDLKYDGKRIEDITDGLYLALQATQHNNVYNDQLNRVIGIREVIDKLKFAEERQIAEGVIGNRYIGVYKNLPTNKQAIEYMTELLVMDHKDIRPPFSLELLDVLNSFGPQAPDPLEKDYFNQIRNLILGQSVPLTPVDPYDVAPDEAIYSYALRQIGQTDNTALTSRQFNKKLKEYFKYHKYNQSALDFADTILDSYKNGTPFPHDQYNYSNTNNVFTQSLEAKDLGFRLQQSKIDANRMLEGLPDILDGLSKLPNSNNLIGEFIQRLAGVNGIDMEGKLTFAETASLFKFTNVYSEPRSRYLNIQVDFKENVGARLCENNIRFPSLLINPFGILAGLALANGGDVDFDDEIVIDNSVSPCVRDIIRRLQLKDTHGSVNPDIPNGGNNHVAQTIFDTFAEDPDFTLVFKEEDIVVTDGGIANGSLTYDSDNNEAIITLDPDYLKSATQLSIAKTIIHESIHAKIKRTGILREVETTFWKILNEVYRQDNGGVPEHEYMAQWIHSLAASLASWDFHGLSPEYYRRLSFGGLEKSPTYLRLPKEERDKIDKIVENERKGNRNAKGEPCPK